MSFETISRWTCDRCGAKIEQKFAGHEASPPMPWKWLESVGHLCDSCHLALQDFLRPKPQQVTKEAQP